jgi:hypothetical protein
MVDAFESFASSRSKKCREKYLAVERTQDMAYGSCLRLWLWLLIY